MPRTTPAEKAELVFHDVVVAGPDGALAEADPRTGGESTRDAVVGKLVSHSNLLGPVADVRATTTWCNRLQELASTSP